MALSSFNGPLAKIMIFSSWKKRRESSNKTESLTKKAIREEHNLNFNDIKLDTDSSPSLLGSEIKIIGKVSSKGSLQLDGVLEGEI